MCGRYSVTISYDEAQKRFKVETQDKYQPRYNAAPSQPLPVITSEDPGKLQLFRWGLIHGQATDKAEGMKRINARAEGLQDTFPYRFLLRKRCLIPADGFYEWQRISAREKQPFRFILHHEAPFALAGLWDVWQPAEGVEPISSFTIITTKANSIVGPVHDRMPVILHQEDEAKWLDEDLPASTAISLLKPFPSELMEAYPVSTLVNSPANDKPQIIREIKPERQGDLFG